MKPTVRFNTPYAEDDDDDDSRVQRQDIPTHPDGLEYEESYEEHRSALVYFLSDVASTDSKTVCSSFFTFVCYSLLSHFFPT